MEKWQLTTPDNNLHPHSVFLFNLYSPRELLHSYSPTLWHTLIKFTSYTEHAQLGVAKHNKKSWAVNMSGLSASLKGTWIVEEEGFPTSLGIMYRQPFIISSQALLKCPSRFIGYLKWLFIALACHTCTVYADSLRSVMHARDTKYTGTMYIIYLMV